jgi:hypothetical protein
MTARSEAIRLARAHLVAAQALIDALDDAPTPAAQPEEPELACPHCREKREEKLEETSYAAEGGAIVPRRTCLSCGMSFNPTDFPGGEVAVG